VADLSGMRRGEVVVLTRQAVDLQNRDIVLTVTKSNRVRRVPINDALAQLLEQQIKAMPQGHQYLFVQAKGRPYTLNAITRAFRRAALKAGSTTCASTTCATTSRPRLVGSDMGST